MEEKKNLLTYAGLKKLEEGVNPVILRNGLNYYLPFIQKRIDELSTPIKEATDLAKIATISSGAEEVGILISNAYQEVGQKGIVTIEESQGLEDYLDVVKGYSYDRGYLSSYMINDKEKFFRTAAINVSEAGRASEHKFKRKRG